MTVSLAKNPIIPANHVNALRFARAQEIKSQMETLANELANLTATLGASAPTMGKVIVEGLGTFTVSENNTYDETSIREALSPGQVKRVSVSKIDKAVVKRLYPDVYAAAKRNLGRKVSIG